MTSASALTRLAQEARYFAEYLEQSASDLSAVEDLIDRYLDWKGLSAEGMRTITDEYLSRDEWVLDAMVGKIEGELRSRLADVFPLNVMTVRRYGHTHRKLFEYLADHRGRPVSAARLRALTGDQTHTERRVRELRDIGLRIEAVHRNGQNVYELVGDSPDIDVAIGRFAPEFAGRVKDWSPAHRAIVLSQVGIH